MYAAQCTYYNIQYCALNIPQVQYMNSVATIRFPNDNPDKTITVQILAQSFDLSKDKAPPSPSSFPDC